MRASFFRLTGLHLRGPLGYEYVRYVVQGAVNLTTLSLDIEWPDTMYCNVLPAPKDLLGREYLEEVRRSNPLSKLEEIHFLSQQQRGMVKLNKDFALHIVEEFKELKHFGTFRLGLVYSIFIPSNLREKKFIRK